jgi:hypothetical protein
MVPWGKWAQALWETYVSGGKDTQKHGSLKQMGQTCFHEQTMFSARKLWAHLQVPHRASIPLLPGEFTSIYFSSLGKFWSSVNKLQKNQFFPLGTFSMKCSQVP